MLIYVRFCHEVHVISNLPLHPYIVGYILSYPKKHVSVQPQPQPFRMTGAASKKSPTALIGSWLWVRIRPQHGSVW